MVKLERFPLSTASTKLPSRGIRNSLPTACQLTVVPYQQIILTQSNLCKWDG